MQDVRNVGSMTEEVVCQRKHNFLCVLICALFVTLYSLTYIFAGAFAGETLDTCATSLAKISPHVLNLSPVNKLERQNCASEVTSERDH